MSELKKLEGLLAQGKFNRRDFLARLAALGITTTLPSILSATPANAATSKKGVRLRLGMAGGSTTDSRILQPSQMPWQEVSTGRSGIA